MNTLSPETTVYLFLAGIILGTFAYVFYIQSLRYKNVYSFTFPGWTHTKDPQTLYEIEYLFTQGLVSQMLDLGGYSIARSHSHLQRDRQNQFTGLVGLKTVVSTGVFNSGSNSGIVSGGHEVSGGTYRYFWARKNELFALPIKLDSTDMAKTLPIAMADVLPELQSLEKSFGLNCWNVLGNENNFVVLAPELFNREEIENFLAICERILNKVRRTQN